MNTSAHTMISILVLLFFGATSAFAKSDEMDRKHWQAPSREAPFKEISVIITEEGYLPKNIIVFSGERVRLLATTLTKDPSCLLIAGKDVFLSMDPGKLTMGEVEFDRAGEFPMYCPNGKQRGTLTVISRNEEDRKFLQKKMVLKEDNWVPKE